MYDYQHMNKELLQKLVSEGKTIKDIAREFKKSCTVTRYWIKKHEIPFIRKRGPISKTGLIWTKEVRKKMNVTLQKNRSVTRKLHFIQVLGGKCSCCGYNKNWAALDFHHINPELKTISMDLTSMGHYSEDVLETEAKNCILLCSNCHREHHNPDKFIN